MNFLIDHNLKGHALVFLGAIATSPSPHKKRSPLNLKSDHSNLKFSQKQSYNSPTRSVIELVSVRRNPPMRLLFPLFGSRSLTQPTDRRSH